MGPYGKIAPPTLLAARHVNDGSARSDLAMLNGSRLVSINELPGGMTLDENVTKQLAGREPISARFLYKEHFSYLPRFTPWIRTNHRPIIKGVDDGIWRRLVILPFRKKFAPYEQNPNLESQLLEEAEGILAWMVQGAKMYLKNGFTQSDTMKLELNQYRSASDLLGEFLQDHTVRNSKSEVLQTSLFLEYKMWCEKNSLHCVSKRTFTEQLNERGYQNRKSGANRYYVGLEISGVQ